MRIKLLLFILIGFSLIYLITFLFSRAGTTTVSSAKELKKPIVIEEEILFVSNKEGNQEIYMMDLKTKVIQNISNNRADDMNPQVSPDGTDIVFYSNRDGDNEIYKMDLKTNKVTQLTENKDQDYDPSYSHDGKKITFKSNRDDKLGDIFVMYSDGSGQSNITTNSSDSEEWDPVFTPDDKDLIFTIRRGKDDTDELASLSMETSEIQELTDNNVPDWYPAIQPKKDILLYISKTDPKNPDDLFTSTLSGDNRVQLTSLPGNDADPAWNADGDKIVFINDHDGDYDLYIMNADGTAIRQIMNTTAQELSPVVLKQ